MTLVIALLPLVPLLAAGAILFVPSEKRELLRRIALTSCGLCFAITLFFLLRFQPGRPGFQFLVRCEWIPELGIAYQAGLDGINMVLCLLHALVSLAGAFVSCSVKERLKEYLFFYLLLVASLYGVFTALDLFFIYLFYEMTLIPLYPMIGIWGSKNKEYGAMKLTIYITTGAVLALFGLLMLYRQAPAIGFDFIRLAEAAKAAPFPGAFQKALVPFFLIGFGVIASLWPLHSWSPIGYATAPTSVSMLHAGVLKKMGPYLMIRLALTLMPAGIEQWSPWLAGLAGIGILYAAWAAIWQKDLKFMVGFSSVSHMGYVLLGLAAMNPTALSGAVLLMFSHGVMAACLFALIGYLYGETHVRSVDDFGGLAKKVPFIAVCFVMASLASAGVPGFSNFASELLIFIGAWRRYAPGVVIAVCGIFFTAVYLFRAVQKVCYGPVNPKWAALQEPAGFAGKFPFVLLLGALLLFGFWPQGLLQMISPAVGTLLP